MQQSSRGDGNRKFARRWGSIVVAIACLATAMVGVSAAIEPAPEAEALFQPYLVYSLSGDRLDAQRLDGAVIPAGSNISIWVAPVFYGAKKVDFDLNGRHWLTEGLAPWDFNGTGLLGGPQPIWSGHERANVGDNTIVAEIDRWWWRDRVARATFEIEPQAQSTWTKGGLGLDFSEADGLVDDYVRDVGLNGAGLVVVHPDEGIVHESYRGEITPDRISLLMSSVKMITAGVLLHLQDEGLIDLNTPISEVPALTQAWGNQLEDFTTAQLMSNSSGLPALVGPTPPFFGYLGPVNGCGLDIRRVLLECGRDIAQNRNDDWLSVEPDSEFRYGGPQWQVAGAIAEQVSGKPWAQLIDEIYVEPCDLDVLGYTGLLQLGYFASTEPLIYPGGFDGNLDTLAPTLNPTMEGGGYTTPRDYADLLLMLLRDGKCGNNQVLSPEAIDMMMTDRTGPAYGGQSYGLGWFIDGDVRVDPGAFGAEPWIDLGRGYGGYLVVENVQRQEGRDELIESVGKSMDASALAANNSIVRVSNAQLSGAFARNGEGAAVPSGTGYNGAGASATPNSATFGFDVPVAGYYSMVGSVKSPNPQDDSFWVTVNGQPSKGYLWDTGVRSAYGDSTVTDRGQAGPVVAWFDAGPNQVGIHHREDGTLIRSMQLVPAAPSQAAADAVLSGQFASDGQGVGAPNGVRNNGAGASATTSAVTFSFDVRQAGYFNLVGTVKAPNGRDDSFWVTVNDEPGRGVLWDTGRRTSYAESTVSNRGEAGATIVWLPEGINTVRVSLREDGTYISSMALQPA